MKYKIHEQAVSRIAACSMIKNEGADTLPLLSYLYCKIIQHTYVQFNIRSLHAFPKLFGSSAANYGDGCKGL